MKYWYHPLPWYLAWLRVPAALFNVIIRYRRQRYQAQPPKPFSVPVIVIGNIVAGGGGKSPLVQAIAHELNARGLSVAVVSRGYKGQLTSWPVVVGEDTSIREVGDEAVMHARAGLNIVCDPDRARAVRSAIATFAPDVVLSDDGLQHYAMHRDVEIAVVDAVRGFGNGRLIPAGPLREPIERWQEVDMRVVTQIDTAEQPNEVVGDAYAQTYRVEKLVRLIDGHAVGIDTFAGHFVSVAAAIADPQRVVRSLEARGVRVTTLREFTDHANIDDGVFSAEPDTQWIVTSKDAVKLNACTAENVWELRVRAQLDEAFYSTLLEKADLSRA